MNQYYARPIDEQHEAVLKALLRPFGELTDEQRQAQTMPLPKPVIQAYWDRKVHYDRLSARMDVNSLMGVIDASGVRMPLPGDPTVVEEAQQGKYEPGTMVEISWRNGWKLVEFRSADAKGIHVVMDGEDRHLEPNREMRIPEPVEV